MELYLRWLDKYERKTGEEPPIGIILCTAKDQGRIELLELHKTGIRVAEYITALPPTDVLQSCRKRPPFRARASRTRMPPTRERLRREGVGTPPKDQLPVTRCIQWQLAAQFLDLRARHHREGPRRLGMWTDSEGDGRWSIDSEDGDINERSHRVDATLAAKLNLVDFQNAVPFLRVMARQLDLPRLRTASRGRFELAVKQASAYHEKD